MAKPKFKLKPEKLSKDDKRDIIIDYCLEMVKYMEKIYSCEIQFNIDNIKFTK